MSNYDVIKALLAERDALKSANAELALALKNITRLYEAGKGTRLVPENIAACKALQKHEAKS